MLTCAFPHAYDASAITHGLVEHQTGSNFLRTAHCLVVVGQEEVRDVQRKESNPSDSSTNVG